MLVFKLKTIKNYTVYEFIVMVALLTQDMYILLFFRCNARAYVLVYTKSNIRGSNRPTTLIHINWIYFDS
jgi:hypothetical protein